MSIRKPHQHPHTYIKTREKWINGHTVSYSSETIIEIKKEKKSHAEELARYFHQYLTKLSL